MGTTWDGATSSAAGPSSQGRSTSEQAQLHRESPWPRGPKSNSPPPPRACLKVSKPARPGAACRLVRHSACSEFPNVHTVDKPTRTLRGRNRSPQVGNGSEEWLGPRCSLLDAGPVSSDSRVIPAGGRRPLVTHLHPEPLPSLLPGTLASPCLQAGPQLPVPQIPNSPKCPQFCLC